MELLSRDDPYDPDMTVAEALERGLIAVIDGGGIIGRTYSGMCGVENFDTKDTNQFCTRSKGHDGVHAYIVRWSDQSAVREWTDQMSSPLADMRKAMMDMNGPVTLMREKMEQQLNDITLRVAKAKREQEEQYLRKALDKLKPTDMSIEEYAQNLTESGRRSVQRIAESMRQQTGDVEEQTLHKIDSMVYGVAAGAKRQRFRDQNAGKVRGR